MDAYETLGLKRGLVYSEEVVREAFREAGKRAHPDAGGDEGDFSKLREATAILSSPSRRLAHWMELQGTPVNPRGVIDAGMMDVFTEVGEVTQKAEAVIRRRDEAKSALVRAMMEGETQLCREQVEEAIAKVDGMITTECSDFEAIENGTAIPLESAATIVRNLAFLEKWRSGLRSCFSRLV